MLTQVRGIIESVISSHKKSIFFQMLVFFDVVGILNFVVRINSVGSAFEVFVMLF